MPRGLGRTAWMLSGLLGVLLSGCGSSRWAMDDPDYAAKYSKPYARRGKLCRMAKQMIDARHVSGKSGRYIGTSVAGDPVAVGGQAGAFGYLSPEVSTHVALAGVAGTAAEDMFVGLDTGLRFQPPTRFAPFVGGGFFLGYNEKEVLASDDLIDNDDDGTIDEWREMKTTYHFLGAVYPEIGAHFWLDGTTRLTASGSYYVNTTGRANDFWFFGLYFSKISRKSTDDAVIVLPPPPEHNVEEETTKDTDDTKEKVEYTRYEPKDE
ncbi:MAG: hypothetical protein JW818_13165 [Pirellulales bacterium]|nr:hypothetical protein [Pirellulales bacterium]